MHTFTLFLLAAAGLCGLAYCTDGFFVIPELMPENTVTDNVHVSGHQKPGHRKTSIKQISQQREKFYTDYIDSEAWQKDSSVPVDEGGDFWLDRDERPEPKSYLEIPWLDEKMYKEIRKNPELSTSMMRSVLNDSFKKYGFKVKVNDPIYGEIEKDVIYDVDEELSKIAKALANESKKSKNKQAAAKTDKKRKQEMDPRQIRENTGIRTKSFVAEDLDNLKNGFKENSVPDITVYDSLPSNPTDTLLGAALITIFSAAVTMAVIAFIYGWYTLVKRVKAAADVEYPAYGVTGPTSEATGDKRLAHSAHIYHYQHQKQNIIAMEGLNEAEKVGEILSPERHITAQSDGLETSNGSVSDPDSEEERAEGDYTVYECPGFATTGDMEVKNPMFTEELTPSSSATYEFVVHQQPKE